MNKQFSQLLCPRCRSKKVDAFSGVITGIYFCRKCGYQGALVLEKKR